jgi:hypothetical protein
VACQYGEHSKRYIKPSNTLDLIIIATNSALSHVISHSQISPSDHYPIFCELNIQPPCPPPLTNISFRCIDAIHIPHLVRDIFSSSLINNPPSSLLALVDCYNFTLSSRLNKHAPLSTKAVHSRPSQPWFTSQLHALKISGRQSQRIWARTHSAFDLKRLRALQQIGIKLLSLRPNALFMFLLFLLFSRTLVNFGKLLINFFIVNLLMLYQTLHPSNLSNTFASFFLSKIHKLRINLRSNSNSATPHIPCPHIPPRFDVLCAATFAEVFKLISESPDTH